MKIKIKHRVVAMTLAVMMTAAPVWGTVHADDSSIDDASAKPVAESYQDNEKQEKAEKPAAKSHKESEKPEKPEKPEAKSHEDNGKIEEYNKKVDEYNKSAKEHNEKVDREYEAAVKEAEEKNAEIDQHNAAENERVEAAESRNAQAVKDAEEANAKIDEENAAEEASVNEHNSSEDEKVKASAEAKKAAEDENESIKAHNEAVEKYAVDKAKYDADYAQYQTDLKYEQLIKAKGYASVEQYNDMINTYYNEPAKASVEKNASAKTVSAKDTYAVTEAADKAGASVKVHIEHVFEGTDISYIEDFDIDRNDVITINSIAALGNATEPGYASLYYNTDNAHKMGYWVPYIEFQYNASYMNSSWNCGTSYEVSYKDGTIRKYDSEDIVAIYTYTWVPLKTYKTYNTPVAPTEPENPGEAKELVEVPELYKPEYKEYVQKQHVEAKTEVVEAANILEYIASPIKGEYLELLSYMDLFDVPVIEIAEETAAEIIDDTPAPAEVPEAPAADKTKVAAATVKIALNDAPTAGINEAAETVAIENVDTPKAESVDIIENEAPLAGNPVWALINLIMTIVTGLISAVLLAGWFSRKKDENENENEDDKTERKGFVRAASLIPAVGSVIAFILTENMNNPMVLVDRWTILMAVILLIQAAVAILAKKNNKKEDNSEAAEAMNA